MSVGGQDVGGRRAERDSEGAKPQAMTSDEAFKLARRHQRHGKVEEAKRIYEKILRATPDHADSLHHLGLIDYDEGRNDQALTRLRRSVMLKPGKSSYHSNIGIVFQRLDLLYEAELVFRLVTTLEPERAEGFFSLGLVLQKQERWQEAEVPYGRAIELKPDYADALNNLGTVFHKQDKWQDAEGYYRRSLELEPDDVDLQFNLACVLQDLNKLEAARAAYERTLKLKADHVKAHNKLAKLWRDEGKLAEAIAGFERAIELQPDYAEAYYNIARVHTFVPDDPLIGRMEKLLGQEGLAQEDATFLRVALALAHEALENHDQAFAHYRQAMEEMGAALPYDAADHGDNIEAFMTVFDRRHPSVGERPSPAEQVPIFVIGMSRSGKTLAESLIAQHDEVFGAGERKDWTDGVKDLLDQRGITRPLPECMEVLSEAQIREFGDHYMAQITKSSPDSRYFVNTLPGHYLHVGLLLQALPSAILIHCHRDPVDNCLFSYFKRYAHGNAYSYDLGNLGAFYRDYHDLMAHWLKLYGDRILTVRYEDMVQDPLEAARRLYQHCGLDFDRAKISADFNTEEIGHWRNHQAHLEPLRRALGDYGL